MRKREVHIGEHYYAHVSEKIMLIRIISANPLGGWNAINLRTGKPVRIKTAARLRGYSFESMGKEVPLPREQKRIRKK